MTITIQTTADFAGYSKMELPDPTCSSRCPACPGCPAWHVHRPSVTYINGAIPDQFTVLSIGPLRREAFGIECPALQDLRDKRPHLFDGAQTDAMVLFMWQDDIIGVVRFIDECLERILYTSDQL